MIDRIRVAALQYFIRPVASFEQFADQVSALVETAKDYRCQLVVFPEYFTAQLLTLGNVKRPIHEQIRDLAGQESRYVELMRGLSRKHKMYIVGGTIPVLASESNQIFNESFFFSPRGEHAVQSKLHMTRFESEEWLVSPGNKLNIFETDFGRVCVQVCYDVEFPELARVAARNDAYILVVPSCTDDRQGYMRVRYCAHARTIENQMYVINAPVVGSIPMVPAVSLNYGQASILTPSDFPFSRDGILAEGVPNQETMVVGELNLTTIRETRQSGTVLPLRDSQRTHEVASQTDIIVL